MSNFAIMTDNCSDLTAEIRERFGIDYIQGHLQMPDGRNVPLSDQKRCGVCDCTRKHFRVCGDV